MPPRNGSGTYTLPTPENPVSANTVIDPDDHNATLDDVATALTASLVADGQKVPTANQPMGGFKHTGAAAGTASGHYLLYGQASADLSDGNNFGSTTFDGTLTMSAKQIDEADRVDVASVAGTVNLDTALANYIRITGTEIITAFTLSNGNRRHVVAGGAFSITAGASLIFPGIASGVTVTLAAGDTFTIIGEASSVVRVQTYTRALGGADGLLSTTTASAAASADITLPVGYRYYEVFYDATVSANGDEIFCRVGTGTPPTYLSGAGTYQYGWSRIDSGGTAISAGSAGDTSIHVATNVGNDATEGADGVVRIFNPASATRLKTILFDTTLWDNAATSLFARITGGGSYDVDGTAITGIQFLASSGTITGTFKLYGRA